MAFGQLIYGPLSDSYGRRPLALAGFALFLFGCVVSLLARDFTTMLVGRFLQGLGAAGPRIISIAIVRDRYEGRAMASVMSLTMTLFILIPIVAPSIGQAMLSLASWRMIFAAMLGLGVLTVVWFALRMDESLPEIRRMPLSLGRVLSAFAEVARNRRAAGPALGAGCDHGRADCLPQCGAADFWRSVRSGRLVSRSSLAAWRPLLACPR